MLRLLRAVARDPVYRTMCKHLETREPDDVWYEPGEGWMIAFPLLSAEPEQLVLFVVHPTVEHHVAQVRKALKITRDTSGVSAEKLDAM